MSAFEHIIHRAAEPSQLPALGHDRDSRSSPVLLSARSLHPAPAGPAGRLCTRPRPAMLHLAQAWNRGSAVLHATKCSRLARVVAGRASTSLLLVARWQSVAWTCHGQCRCCWHALYVVTCAVVQLSGGMKQPFLSRRGNPGSLSKLNHRGRGARGGFHRTLLPNREQ